MFEAMFSLGEGLRKRQRWLRRCYWRWRAFFLPSVVEVASAGVGAGESCDGVYVFLSVLDLAKGLEIRGSECE